MLTRADDFLLEYWPRHIINPSIWLMLPAANRFAMRVVDSHAPFFRMDKGTQCEMLAHIH